MRYFLNLPWKKVIIILSLCFLFCYTNNMYSQNNTMKSKIDTVFLWPDHSKNNVPTPESDRPLMEVHFPKNITGEKLPCIIVFPGGGYHGVAYPLEGKPYADFFNKHGYICAVVLYRVNPNHFPAPYADACRAIRLIKDYADKFSIDSSRIAIMGSSAGGHLVTTVATRPSLYMDPDDDLANRISAKPKCHIAMYPVISFVEHAHEGSVMCFLGDERSDERKKLFSNELHVTEDTPPVFIYHNDRDPTVPVENSLMYAAACAKHNVPFVLHVYPYNTHAEGLATDIPELKSWSGLLLNWLKEYL